jgi:hypothetical protein
MNAITPLAPAGHNNPPVDLHAALEPRALAAMIAAALARHTAATAALLAEYQRFAATTAAGIADDATDARAVEFAADIKIELDNTDATRAEIKAPVLAAQKAIDGAARVIADQLDAARTEVQRRHTAYLIAKDTRIRAEAREAAARAEEAAWAAAQEANETGEVDKFVEAAAARAEQYAAEAVVFAPVLATTRMRTASGVTSGLKDDWKFVTTDLAQVPAQYLQINEAAIKAAIRAGVRSIPGLRIFNQPRAR